MGYIEHDNYLAIIESQQAQIKILREQKESEHYHLEDSHHEDGCHPNHPRRRISEQYACYLDETAREVRKYYRLQGRCLDEVVIDIMRHTLNYFEAMIEHFPRNDCHGGGHDGHDGHCEHESDGKSYAGKHNGS